MDANALHGQKRAAQGAKSIGWVLQQKSPSCSDLEVPDDVFTT